jgi:hypothetical protein
MILDSRCLCELGVKESMIGALHLFAYYKNLMVEYMGINVALDVKIAFSSGCRYPKLGIWEMQFKDRN